MARQNLRGEWRNLKEQQIRFRSFARAVDGVGSNRIDGAGSTVYQRIKLGITDAYAVAARMIRDRTRSNAAATRAPRRLWSGARPAIFSFADFSSATDSKRSRSSMVGVRTGLSHRAKDPSLYVTWGVGAKRRKGGSVATRGLSMSFGALFERGTQDRRIRPRRYFRSAIYATRSAVLRMLANAYRKAADAFNR